MIESWGEAPDGSEVLRVCIRKDGLSVFLLSYGATIQDIRLEGVTHGLVLGYPSLPPYLDNPNYFGASVGRYANRISNGQTRIDGVNVSFDRNNGKHHLHGGTGGSSFRNWSLVEVSENSAVFQDTLLHGHMGYPGNLSVTATFRVEEGPSLYVTYRAETDAPTLCNFTTHNYFNLDGSGTLEHHSLQVDTERYLPVDTECIPTGSIEAVSASGFDLRSATGLWGKYGARSLDLNFCVGEQRRALRKIATLSSALSNLRVDLSTTEPGLQVYTGEFITGLYAPFSGVALEPQLWPDAPNNPDFPESVLRPGDVSEQQTLFEFLIDKDAPNCVFDEIKH